MAIVFDESLRTGNGLIDTQHQELIARVNKLTEDCRVGAEKLVAVQTLNFLRRRMRILFWRPIRGSTPLSLRRWKSFRRCWRRKKVPAKPLWRLLRRTWWTGF